jgi:hypothetical protein
MQLVVLLGAWWRAGELGDTAQFDFWAKSNGQNTSGYSNHIVETLYTTWICATSLAPVHTPNSLLNTQYSLSRCDLVRQQRIGTHLHAFSTARVVCPCAAQVLRARSTQLVHVVPATE